MNNKMKTTTLSLVLLVIIYVSHARPSNYEKIMLENIGALYEAKNNEEYQEVINKFSRIANKETDKWEPLYYISFGYVMMAANSEEAAAKDKFLDLALEKIKEGLEIAPQESELVALKGFVHMLRITVDPATRGQQYAGLSMQSFGKALELDPENPRTLYLMGQMELGTAQFFGADTSEACGKLKASIEKFDTYQSGNVLAPTWGKKSAEATVGRCQ